MRTQRRLVLLAGLALAAPVLALLGRTAAAGGDEPVDARTLAWHNQILARQYELAKGEPEPDAKGKKKVSEGGKDFYLLLDPNAGRLYLKLRNAVLQDFPIHGLRVGVPEVLFKARRPDGEWQGRIFREGTLVPARSTDRVVITAPFPTKEGNEGDATVPPTPDEMYPVPPRYHIRYEGNVSLEVRTDEGDAATTWKTRLSNRLSAWWTDAKEALGGGDADTLRLRLVMSPDDAKSLYRALPAKTKLMVLPKE